MTALELLVGTAVLMVPLWVIVPRLRDWYQARQTERWALTTGVITESRLEPREVRGRYGPMTIYVPHIAYRYTVDGVTHTGTRICIGELPRYVVEEQAAERIAAYGSGAEVPVVYNPAAPGEALLETQSATEWFEVIAAALFFCGILWIMLRAA